MKGSTSSAKINTDKAAIKIGTLIAADRAGKGDFGKIIRSLTKTKGDKTPPPTTSPLPWEKDEKEEKKSEKKEKKKKKKKIKIKLPKLSSLKNLFR